jgi:hypothetical protein
LDWEDIFLGVILPGTTVIKVKAKLQFTLAQAMKVQNGRRGPALLCTRGKEKWFQLYSRLGRP